MRILFVYPNISTGNGLHYNHGIGALSATLKQAGHHAELITLEQEPEDREFLAGISRADPDLVAVSFGSHQWKQVRRLSDLVNRELNLPVLAGGVHATHASEQTIDHHGIDMLCRGEGEQAIVETAAALEAGGDLSKIENLWLKDDEGRLIKNQVRPLIEKLDSLPFVDREIFDMDGILRVNAGEMSMMAGRGCPYGCAYCCNNALIELYRGKGRYVRYRSVDHLLSEIEELAGRYPIRTLYFEDDIFTLKKDWVEEFCQKYKRSFSFPFRIYIHVQAVDLELLTMLREAGLYMVNVGVESGNERIRREVMKRKMTNERIEQVFCWLHDLDIIVRDFNIVGLPGETPETMRETMELNRRILPDQVQVSIFYPYPGTELYNTCREAGYLTDEERQTYFETKSILNMPDLSGERIKEAYLEFCRLAETIQAERFQKDLLQGENGYFDFLNHYDRRRVIEGAADQVRLERFLIEGRRRFVLFEHPRARLTFPEVEIRPGTLLRFGLALDPSCLTWGGAGVRFRVLAKDKDDEMEVFNEAIDPKGDLAQRSWQDREVDLGRWAGKRISLSFCTDPDPGEDLTGAWAGWSRPHLIVGDMDKS